MRQTCAWNNAMLAIFMLMSKDVCPLKLPDCPLVRASPYPSLLAARTGQHLRDGGRGRQRRQVSQLEMLHGGIAGHSERLGVAIGQEVHRRVMLVHRRGRLRRLDGQ